MSAETAEGTCRPQENRLTLIFTLGLFAVNFGPVPVGLILDAWGPRCVSVLGCGVTVLGLVLFGVSHSGAFDAFCAASLLIGAPSGIACYRLDGATSSSEELTYWNRTRFETHTHELIEGALRYCVPACMQSCALLWKTC